MRLCYCYCCCCWEDFRPDGVIVGHRPLTRSGCTGTSDRPLLLRLHWLAGQLPAAEPGCGVLHPS